MNKRSSLKKLLVGLTSLVMLFGLTLVVSATTIPMNADPDDWPGNNDPGCVDGTDIGEEGCSLLANDPAESELPNIPPMDARIDIRSVWGTNDTEYLYFRYDTEENAQYLAGQYVRICINIPNQGPGESVLGCNINTDQVIFVQGRNDNNQRVYVGDCNEIVSDGGSCNENSDVVSDGTRIDNMAGGPYYVRIGQVTEIKVPLNLLNIDENDDGDTLFVVLYSDDGDEPPDDRVPDSGNMEFQIGTGSPTAVSFGSFTAISGSVSNAPQAIAIVALLVLALLSFGFVMVRRQSAQG